MNKEIRYLLPKRLLIEIRLIRCVIRLTTRRHVFDLSSVGTSGVLYGSYVATLGVVGYVGGTGAV
jgi:hypothetical protein